MRFILASSSPRRQRLLRGIGIDFDTIQPRVDETRRLGEAPIVYAERLSREKARTVADALANADALILAADTIVVSPDGELLGKPTDANDARRMLLILRGRQHEVITAFTLLPCGAESRAITRHVRTRVVMRDYAPAEVDAYINSGDPFDKAGAYAIQNQAFQPVARIDGSYSNVVGLPLDELRCALREIGWRV